MTPKAFLFVAAVLLIAISQLAWTRPKAAGARIHSITYGSPYKYNTGYATKYILSDVWSNTWADDDKIYAVHDDSGGWQEADRAGSGRNLEISQLSGYTSSLTGTIVNTMDSFGTQGQTGADSASYKANGIISIRGTLYASVSRHITSGLSAAPFLQTTSGGQIIKSTDHGAAWTPAPPSTAEPYVSPMFSEANFSNAFFVQYGKDYQNQTVDNSGTYVYAVSTDGAWNNGSHLYLGRVKIANIASLSRADWSFYKGGDGSLDASWTSTLANAVSIIDDSQRIGMNGIQYLPAFQSYVFVQWWYPAPPNSMSSGTTNWRIWQAPHPWGPWSVLPGYTAWTSGTSGYYNPNIMPKSLQTDGGLTATLSMSGDFNSQDPATGLYTLTLLPVTIQ